MLYPLLFVMSLAIACSCAGSAESIEPGLRECRIHEIDSREPFVDDEADPELSLITKSTIFPFSKHDAYRIGTELREAVLSGSSLEMLLARHRAGDNGNVEPVALAIIGPGRLVIVRRHVAKTEDVRTMYLVRF
jgi:hypothetical protein